MGERERVCILNKRKMGLAKFIFLMVVVFQGAFSSPSLSFNHLCRQDQSLALLRFKQAFTISMSASDDFYFSCYYSEKSYYCGSTTYSKTLSWNGSTDCCKWDGVTCDPSTGYVIELNLTCSHLQGTLHSNSTLFELSHLQRLDLSYNIFYPSQISPKFGNLTNLTHLNLFSPGFFGIIPSQISYLSKLVYLALDGYSSSPNGLRLATENFKLLLRNLTQLHYLFLQDINISTVIPMNLSSSLELFFLLNTTVRGKLPKTIFELPNLSYLNLAHNQDLIVQLPKFNSSSLLMHLALEDCGLEGPIPKSLGNLPHMTYLSLSTNNLIGTIPSSLSNLSHLNFLDLQHNNLEGAIPNSFTDLEELQVLSLGSNIFHGPFPFFITNMTQFVLLCFANNSFTGPIPSNVTRFPNLKYLYLSNNSLSGTIPSWIFSLPSVERLSLAYNRLMGNLEDFQSDSLIWIDVSNNDLHGFVPQSISKLVNLATLNLRSNSFQGRVPIPPPAVSFLLISNNIFTGEIPSLICNLSSLQILDASYNRLSDTIPPCLGNISSLFVVLDLRMNNLSGTISMKFSRGNQLRTLNLNGNHLEGPIPRSLIHCKHLEVLDLGNNELTGAFPLWLQTLPQLQVLFLRSNKFHGSIGTFKSERSFNKLRIMDLSYNNFSGLLQGKNFERLKGMMNGEKQERLEYMEVVYNYYQDSMTVNMKGFEMKHMKILTFFTTIDLSCNNFTGEIPNIIGNFNALRGLNLSHNRFIGQIPPSLGNLSMLEWLDLSSNKLVGRIPEELTSLNFLEVLNLSNNYLVGQIPIGKQFNTFQNNSYGENSGLCSFPLTKGCGSDKEPHQARNTNLETNDDSSFESGFGWKVVLLGYACGFAFSLILGNLLLYIVKPKWFANIVNREEHRWTKRSQIKQL